MRSTHRRSRSGRFLAAGVIAALAVPAPVATGDPSGSAPDAARGLIYSGLSTPRPGSVCGPGHFEVIGSGGAVVGCSHGPDPAPIGIDVRIPRSAAELAASDGAKTADADAVPCVGDGTSGNRVQVIYAVAADRTDRYSSIAPLIRTWASDVQSVFTASAAETGGAVSIRFVHDASCELVVAHVVLSASGDDNLSNTANQLAAQGFNRFDRKYLVWVDANVYCGIAYIYGDDQLGPNNLNNGPPSIPGMVARVDNGCWGQLSSWLSVEAHELMHNLGGVQLSAPNTSGGYHCVDEYDTMCYEDAPGVVLQYLCPADHEKRLDCNHNDYFHTSPAPGSYLATHWNPTTSSFLTTGAPPPTAFRLTVRVRGSGTVASSPTGIACPPTCTADFASGTVVTLTPAAASGWQFTKWSGACTGTGGCSVTLSQAKSVKAVFKQG